MIKVQDNQVDFLFIFAPGGEDTNQFFYHIGSGHIISFLRLNGFTSDQFINNDFINLRTCVGKILKYNARVIGFTVYNSNFIISTLIAEQIKKISPETIIVFGGPGATINSEYILGRYSFVDVCFRNESEETFLQFISQLSDKHFNLKKINPDRIRGTTYRIEKGIQKNPDSNILIQNAGIPDYLDKYPSPFLSGFIPGPAAFNTGLITARGCNQNCVYCNCAVLSKKKFFTHSIDRIISEVDFISRYQDGNQVLNFFDDAFSLIPDRARKICRVIIENKIKINLGCMTRCDCVDEELLDLMKEAGFVSIGFSLESANPQTLRRIGKVHVAEDNVTNNLEKEIRFIEKLHKVTAYAKKIGVGNIFVSIMLGLPGETLNEGKQTIDVIEKNENIDQYSHNFLMIYKGTPLYSDYKKYGYKIRYLDNSPLFPKMTYPDDITKIHISPKSNIHLLKKQNDRSSLGIFSLTSGKDKTENSFRHIVIESDTLNSKLVSWLKDILVINGIIIQIYSNKKSLIRFADKNYEKFIKYTSPSLNIRNYCFGETTDGLLLLSSESLLLKSENEKDNIKLFNFKYLRSNLNNSGVSFMKSLCREVDRSDSSSAYSYLREISRLKNPFSYLMNMKPLPYFENLCKWTSGLANCINKNTLIINEKSELRFCWYGNKSGTVGDSYDEIINKFESEKINISSRRKCSQCKVINKCISCQSPYPLHEAEFCENKKLRDVTQAAELILGLDQIKQILL